MGTGHGVHAGLSCDQLGLFPPLCDEVAIQQGNGCVFLERQPLPPHFWVICHVPGALDGDLPGPGLGDERGGCPVAAGQHLWVRFPTNK